MAPMTFRVVLIAACLAGAPLAEAANALAPCGSARPDLSAIQTAEGLVIAPDGTIYFTQPYGKGASSFLGRYRPPYQKVEARWVDLGGKALGLAFNPKQNTLYAGSRDRKKLLAITLSEPPVVKELADAEPRINGVTLGEDGAVWYTDQGGGHVYRVTSDGVKQQITSKPIEDPNGLAFGPDARLYVLSYARARITRLRVMEEKEIERAVLADLPGTKNADGIAFDSQGRLHVTASDQLWQVSLDGKVVKPLGAAYGANIDFGIGALSCSDIYTAGNGKGIFRVSGDTPGFDVPWHRVAWKDVIPPPNPPPAPPARLASKAKLELVTNETTEALDIVAVPGEAPGRLFVVEKQGPIRILRGKVFSPKPFLDITGKVSLWTRANGEEGLLGLAFHPQYRKNGRFFIHYTDLKGDTRIVEYHADKNDPDHADPTPVREIFYVDQPYSNHNGGDLEFGPDGKLYVGLGDGGNGGDPQGHSQRPDSLLGKMLRIDVDAAKPAPQVMSRGLRNPWRYTFDAKTGDLYIADVGQNIFEMVHFLPAARVSGHTNLGWNVIEAKHCFKAADCERKGLQEAVVEYSHSEGCSITGGYVYRGKAIPALQGHYFFSDYCTAILRSFKMKNGKVTEPYDWKAVLDPEFQLAKISSFGQDQDGELYIVTHEGPIFKLVPRAER